MIQARKKEGTHTKKKEKKMADVEGGGTEKWGGVRENPRFQKFYSLFHTSIDAHVLECVIINFPVKDFVIKPCET